jgi:hypothetical protein
MVAQLLQRGADPDQRWLGKSMWQKLFNKPLKFIKDNVEGVPYRLTGHIEADSQKQRRVLSRLAQVLIWNVAASSHAKSSRIGSSVHRVAKSINATAKSSIIHQLNVIENFCKSRFSTMANPAPQPIPVPPALPPVPLAGGPLGQQPNLPQFAQGNWIVGAVQQIDGSLRNIIVNLNRVAVDVYTLTNRQEAS